MSSKPKRLCWCGKPAHHRCEAGVYGGECINYVCGEHAFCDECYPVPEDWPFVCIACNSPLSHDAYDPTVGLKISNDLPVCINCGLEQPGPDLTA